MWQFCVVNVSHITGRHVPVVMSLLCLLSESCPSKNNWTIFIFAWIGPLNGRIFIIINSFSLSTSARLASIGYHNILQNCKHSQGIPGLKTSLTMFGKNCKIQSRRRNSSCSHWNYWKEAVVNHTRAGCESNYHLGVKTQFNPCEMCG